MNLFIFPSSYKTADGPLCDLPGIPWNAVERPRPDEAGVEEELGELGREDPHACSEERPVDASEALSAAEEPRQAPRPEMEERLRQLHPEEERRRTEPGRVDDGIPVRIE